MSILYIYVWIVIKDFKTDWFKQINFADTPQEKEHLDSLNLTRLHRA